MSTRPAGVILNVNDNEGARYVVTLMLQRAGFSVLEAATGQEALSQIASHRPDLVVLDVQLPDISGLEVCARVRDDPETASTKILHTSATFVSTDNKVRSLEGGADAYLTQPFEPEELLATIHALLRLTRTEEDLRRVADELREEDRRKNEFLAMLAHELRNPLAAIWAALPLLGPSEGTTDSERALAVLARQSRQLKRLIDDLLDVARVTQGKIELQRVPLELGKLLRQVADNAARTVVSGRRQQLHASFPPDSARVSGDPARLEQLFANLLDNASKYTPEGGDIWLEHGVAHGPEGARISITVRDNGVGMPAQTLPQVFSLFAQGEVPLARSGGGLGIGLTLVRRLVELHQGTVTAASEGEGRGSAFVVSLPLLAELAVSDPPDAERPSGVERGPSDRRRRVLLVDDNADLQELLATMIERWGHQVDCAADGPSGLRKATELKPDFALLDIGLPGMDGFALAREIRRALDGQAPRLIAVTGYGAPEKRRLAFDAGFNEVLVKPVDAERLRALLSE
jgi:two-component system, sensor histidine kinase